MSADVVIRFLADTGQLRAQISQVEGTGSKIKSWAKGIGAAVGAAFVAKQVLDMVGAASDLNESMSKTGVVFGKSAGVVERWSKNSATAMGLSRQQALEAAGTYGNLAVALGLPAPKAAAMSTKLVGLASDLASFNNVPIDDVLLALRSGLTGEVEPLRKFGVSLSAARVEAEALRLGLAKGNVDQAKVKQALETTALAQDKARLATAKYGKDSEQARAARLRVASAEAAIEKAMKGSKAKVSDAAKAQAAYSLILHDTKTAQGDFARTSDGLANKQRIMSAQWKDLQAKIGNLFIPAALAAVGVGIKLIDVVSHLGETLSTVVGFVRDNALVFGLLFAAMVALLGPTIAQAAALAVLWVQVTALTVAEKIATAAQWLWNAAIAANPIGLIIAAIIAFVAIIVLAYQRVGWFRAAVDAMGRAAVVVFNAIKTAVVAVYNWIKTNWPLLLAILTGPIGLAVLAIVRNWDRIKAAAAAVLDWLRGAWSAIVGFFAGIAQRIGSQLSLFWHGIQAAAGVVVDWLRSAWNGLVGFFSGIPGRIGAVLGGIADVISAPFRAAFGAIARLWNSTIGRLSFNIPSWVPGIGGKGFDVPDIPGFARGGVITATGIALVHKGETVVPPGAGGGVTIQNLNVTAPAGANPYEFGKAIVDAIRSYETVAGTGWRRTPSGRYP